MVMSRWLKKVNSRCFEQLSLVSVMESASYYEVRMDRLALKFHETKDLKVRDEIYCLCRELIKLD